MERKKTHAERARELTILNDPLANLLSPYFVECKQCKKKIKLSSKSAYDTFHWRNHRARCLRTSKKKGKKPKLSNVASVGCLVDATVLNVTHIKDLSFKQSPPPPTHPKPTPLKTASLFSSPISTTAPSIPSRRSPRTPPLISDSEDDQDRRSEQSSEVRSPTITSPSIPSIHSPTTVSSYEYNVHDYMARSHPGLVPRHATATAENSNWRAWSWAQLKPPQFSTATSAAYDDNDDIDELDDDLPESIPLADEQVQEAARTLSMLARSRAR